MTIERDLEYFVAIAEYKNIGRAAAALNLSQPALSMCLTRLQAFAGSKLVVRSSTGVELTAAGRALLKHVHRLRAAHTDVRREIAEIEEGRVWHIEVGTTDGSSNIRVANASAALLNVTQRITLSIIANDQATLLPRLRRGEIDILVTGAPGPEADDLVQLTVAPDSALVYCSVQNPLAKRKDVSLHDLTQERWAIAAPNGVLYTWLRNRFLELGLSEPEIALASAPLELRLRLISMTRLLGVGSRTVIADAAARLGLRELPVRDLEPIQRRCVVIHRKGGFLSAAAKRLVELLCGM